VGTEGWSHRKENAMNAGNGMGNEISSGRNTGQTDELELVGMTESERNVDDRAMHGVHAV
jgi:hypothetical protein